MSARKCPHGTQITTQSKQNLNFTLQLPASRNKPLRSLTNINTQYRKINTGGLISLIGNISQQLYIHTYIRMTVMSSYVGITFRLHRQHMNQFIQHALMCCLIWKQTAKDCLHICLRRWTASLHKCNDVLIYKQKLHLQCQNFSRTNKIKCLLLNLHNTI